MVVFYPKKRVFDLKNPNFDPKKSPINLQNALFAASATLKKPYSVSLGNSSGCSARSARLRPAAPIRLTTSSV